MISAEIVKCYDVATASQTDEALLALLADNFSACIKAWMENLHRWKYWRQAWTFQEWAMASEIDISYETAPYNERLSQLNNVIVEASTIVRH
jgi:hypothetical protein